MPGLTPRSVVRWFAQLWDDLKAGTDAGLLAVVRFVGLLYGPIDHRLPIDQAFRKALRHRLAGHIGWRHALGGITYLLFMVLVVTGVLLALYYRPSAQEAYPSLQHIVSRVNFGWLVRDLHLWSANLIVVAALAHMARVYFDAAYKPPRETNWLIGLVLLFVILAFGATGYLLPWDQWAYWTVTELLGALGRLPLVGGTLADVLTGDVIVSGATLSRSFAVHVTLLPWVAFALLAFHFALLRRHGPAPPPTAGPGGEAGVPFFPHHLLRSFIASVLTLALAISAAVLYPRPIGDAANPYQAPDTLVSTWIPVDVSLALVRYLGTWGLVGFTLFGLALALLPLIDRRPERRLRQRPVAATLGVLYIALFITAWLAGRQLRTVPGAISLPQEILEERVAPAPPTGADTSPTDRPTPLPPRGER